MQKKLVKSHVDRKICGVCGGIAEYINIDPTVVRLLWILFGCFGAGVIAYIIAAIVMPD
ncbi:PspC domain-containing protein [Clostridium sp. Marseille-P299]|uniref:PspC domain-containing protein n=1 Tax=Clostridium sp. Marseille-P299 TaxID=1805477 RepID=UPI0009EF1BDD|nr:PspC domain-containing protein [Clostridium sp. Marseille-P299]